jgi:hypothetical protein
MKWTAYLDAGAFWLLVIGLSAGLRGNEKIVYGEGVLIEKITSQSSSTSSGIPMYQSVDGSYQMEQMIVDRGIKTDGSTCSYCRGGVDDSSPAEWTLSGILILLYY